MIKRNRNYTTKADLSGTHPKCKHRWLIQAINNHRDRNITFWSNAEGNR
jgi:hypothetical protein